MKKVFSALIVILLTSFAFAQESDMDPEAAKFYNDGNKLLKSGQFNEALKNYDDALKSSKDHRIYYQKGVTLKKLNKYKEAEEAFIKATEVNPNFDIAFNGLGGTYFIEGEYLKAIEAFETFGKLTKKVNLKKQSNEYIARAYAKLGENAKADARYDQAIEYFTKATDHHEYDAAYLFLAEVFVETGKYSEALEAADKAQNYRKNISKGGPLYYKGLAFKKMGDVSKAKESFEEGKKDSKYKNLCEYELKLLM